MASSLKGARTGWPLRGAGGQPYGVAVLRMAHDLGGDRDVAAQGAAELADDGTGAVLQVDVLADQRCASAVGATVPIGLERANAATEQNVLELLDVARGGGHGLKDSLSRARFLPASSTCLAGFATPVWPVFDTCSTGLRHLFATARRRVGSATSSAMRDNPGSRLKAGRRPRPGNRAIAFQLSEFLVMLDIDSLVMIAASDRYKSLHRRAPRQSPSREGGA